MLREPFNPVAEMANLCATGLGKAAPSCLETCMTLLNRFLSSWPYKKHNVFSYVISFSK
jgi:hypothetical protein